MPSSVLRKANKTLFPGFPDLGTVAHGGLFAVADNGSLYKIGYLIKFFQLCIIRCEVLIKRVVLIRRIDHVVHAYGRAHGFELSEAHAVFEDIHELIFYPALLEIALSLFGVKAFRLAENLYIHARQTSVITGRIIGLRRVVL